MPGAARVQDSMGGSVGHHAGHIIGYDYDSEGHAYPIYCSGHSVSGTETSGSSKVFVNGLPAARRGDGGTSDCPCDGAGYTIVGGSSKVFIQGSAAARVGDQVDIHGQGSGNMTSGSSKVIIGG
ncbi:PAAR domain-containing protein (plasmid) [Paenibacillus sp. EC2-1]|uniref:PAAR domain-containing protein n=1 Tax=Paenibacillus sp. EC2-1 TaxID=3388665 RepID=UPI003BEEE54E